MIEWLQTFFTFYATPFLSLFWWVNLIVALIAVFWTKRQTPTIWAWLLVLTLLPVIGWVIYWLAGRRISDKQIFQLVSQDSYGLKNIDNVNRKKYVDKKYLSMVELLDIEADAPLTINNQIERYVTGKSFFDELFKQIKLAKKSIHIEFFSIFDDQIGNQLIKLLEDKALEGLSVRIVYDQFGSKGRHEKLYDQLIDNGGKAIPFLIRSFQLLTLRFNYRLHRKLVVIDGRVGFIGGYNVGDQYLGKKNKFGFWRDTHLKVSGRAVIAMQTRFIADWNATTSDDDQISREENLFFDFNKTKKNSGSAAQIVSSGPDSDQQLIKSGYLKMFNTATKEIIVQSPYFVPDQTILESLLLAQRSGVQVKIMIPNRPDHPFVYRATQYYAFELLDAGATVYRYDGGFLHTKIVMIDGEVASVGSANLDIRSFELNFEANAFIYDKKVVQKLRRDFLKDVEFSKQLTKADVDKQGFWLSAYQRFSRLLSPIL